MTEFMIQGDAVNEFASFVDICLTIHDFMFSLIFFSQTQIRPDVKSPSSKIMKNWLKKSLKKLTKPKNSASHLTDNTPLISRNLSKSIADLSKNVKHELCKKTKSYYNLRKSEKHVQDEAQDSPETSDDHEIQTTTAAEPAKIQAQQQNSNRMTRSKSQKLSKSAKKVVRNLSKSISIRTNSNAKKVSQTRIRKKSVENLNSSPSRLSRSNLKIRVQKRKRNYHNQPDFKDKKSSVGQHQNQDPNLFFNKTTSEKSETTGLVKSKTERPDNIIFDKDLIDKAEKLDPRYHEKNSFLLASSSSNTPRAKVSKFEVASGRDPESVNASNSKFSEDKVSKSNSYNSFTKKSLSKSNPGTYAYSTRASTRAS